MSNNFNLYSKFYDLLYTNKNYLAESKYISDLIKQYSSDAKSILEYGSGTGIHGIELKKLGYVVYGLERSAHMVEKAKVHGFDCEIADIVNYQINKKFDAVIALFHVISYITDNASLEKVFKNASNNLNEGGLFIFDVWYSPAVYSQQPAIRVKRAENDEINIIRIAEPEVNNNNNIVNVNYAIIVKDKKTGICTEFTEIHPMRHFSIPELNFLARFSGFEILKTEEFLSGEEPSDITWGVTFILKKML